MAFVKKDSANHMIITSRSDIYQDFDVQILDIFKVDLSSILLFNVYNEKQIDDENNEYTVKRVLSKIDLLTRFIICDNFNVYYLWWNFKINNSIKVEILI